MREYYVNSMKNASNFSHFCKNGRRRENRLPQKRLSLAQRCQDRKEIQRLSNTARLTDPDTLAHVNLSILLGVLSGFARDRIFQVYRLNSLH
jgi:hypothetical protein